MRWVYTETLLFQGYRNGVLRTWVRIDLSRKSIIWMFKLIVICFIKGFITSHFLSKNRLTPLKMAQEMLRELDSYINEKVVTIEFFDDKKIVCSICLKPVSKSNYKRHKSHHLYCLFCDSHHFLHELMSGKCPIMNKLLCEFFPKSQ